MTVSWSPQQAKALDAVTDWLRNPSRKQVFHLFGYAGTGKTTIAIRIAEIAAEILKGDVLFGAFTGKAAQVMNNKGCIGASTIHSLIYTVKKGTQPPEWILNVSESPLRQAALLIVDECSMLGADLGQDLVSFGKPILVLGDPFQLPPVKGSGFFDTEHPDVMLSEIHRQARDNPIIQMSMLVREGNHLPIGKYGASQVRPREYMPEDLASRADQVICGRNATRWVLNKTVREVRGFTSPIPMLSEKLICLKNNKGEGLLNGSMWMVDEPPNKQKKTLNMSILSMDTEGLRMKARAHAELFLKEKPALQRHEEMDRETQHFTWGYAITAHKSQGSQWKNVLVFDESGVFREDAARWLYTAITRASENVIVAI